MFMLVTQYIWNQFQAIKTDQPRQECCVHGTAFTRFGDVTPVGGLEVNIYD